MSESEKKGFLDRIMSEADSSAHPFLEKIQEHIRTIVLVVGTVLLVAVVYSSYTFWEDRKVTRANNELENILSQDSSSARLSMLQEFSNHAPKRLHGAILLEKARIHMNMENFASAAADFKQLGQIDPDMHPVAVLGQAKAHELSGDHQQALEILKNSSLPGDFQHQYLSLLSFNAEQSGDYAAALDAYQKLMEHSQDMDTGFIEFKIEQLQQKIQS
ncbi:tetratricopeptide repeat protein [Desulfonatronovibrio magnus]|uniref:tetratricopeptide repeat protein n=1 Tax=Desulfonatronovibrio magnus TaxID=698827 RepID=UPI0005EBE351|nr:tetratricopeptide repeat protein [Desulfonatronovibrio magnus]RQD65497.1 MAG: hypothetical protein D5R98_03215 [Desulfonatronovibrio sp. MSAO_Bac4]